MLETAHAIAPFVNTVLTLCLVIAAPFVWLQLRRATPLAIRSELDRVMLDYGSFRRQQAELALEDNRLRGETKQVDQRVTAVNARITAMDEVLHSKLSGLEAAMAEVSRALSSLACSEANWHDGEKPGFCPLHKRDCPLNGRSDESGSGA